MFWGFLAGVATVIATAMAGLLIGLLLALLASAGFISLGEVGGWILIIGLFYGFYVGIVIGLIVWVRFCWVRFREVDNQTRIDGSPR
ncbi:MAG: hypothetical protein P4M01_00545 [Acidobacteriota bacterium]|nr:hypothetical protein [Acidobacteriota bacterium]